MTIQSVSLTSSRGCWLFLAALLVTGCMTRAPSPGDGADEEAVVEPGPLGEYLPVDSAAVLTFNVGKQLGPRLMSAFRQVPHLHERLTLLGIDPLKDLDRVQVVYPANDAGRPLVLFRGRFDRTRFAVGPDRLRTETVPSGEYAYRLYRFPDGEVCAVVSDTLAMSANRQRVVTALDHAAGHKTPHPPDAALAAALAGVDRRQEIWLAAAVGKLGSLAEPNNKLLRVVQKGFLEHTESVSGGVKVVGDDLTGDLSFRCVSEDGAGVIEKLVRDLTDIASGAEFWLAEKQYLPLMKLLGTGRVGRDGKTVTLRCRLALDELGP
jgi:hypothetical protein